MKRRTIHPGFTLIELMVATAIIVILLFAAGKVLTSAQRVVSATESNMRDNTRINAVQRVIRDDFRQASKQGFFAIVQKTDETPILILTAAGPTPSITDTAVGNGALVMMGQCLAKSGDSSPVTVGSLLWREAWILNRGLTPSTLNETADSTGYDFASLQMLGSVANVRTFIGDVSSGIQQYAPQHATPGYIKITPETMTLSDITQGLWKVLAPRIIGLTIDWTDGSKDPTYPNQLAWFGPDRAAYTGSDNPEQSVTGYNYYALWTSANQNNWPRLVRIRFTLLDETRKPMNSSRPSAVTPRIYNASEHFQYQPNDLAYELVGLDNVPVYYYANVANVNVPFTNANTWSRCTTYEIICPVGQ